MKKILCLTFIIALMVGLMTGFSSQRASAESQQTYTIQRGDTLWKISQRYHVGLKELIKANPQIVNPDLIYPGHQVKIPKIPSIKQFEKRVIELTNKEREKQGLEPLKANWQVSRVARYKARDMRDNNYFEHKSPTYGSPFQMMRDFNISFTAAGENIAAGQSTPQSVVDAWMKSKGHRKNILSSKYTQIGVGYVNGGSYGHYWSQMFITK